MKRYLEALAAHQPKRGRKRTVESIDRRLAKLDELMSTADAFKRLSMTQERIDLEKERERLSTDPGAALAEIEAEFVQVAATYGESKGYTYDAWREVGVAPAVLQRAGITRASTGSR